LRITTKPNLLVVVNQWPEPTSTAAGQHLIQVLESLVPVVNSIVIGHTADKTDRSYVFDSNAITSRRIFINDSEFDSFLIDFAPQIVLFDRFTLEEQFGWRVSECCPDAMRILNTEDLHGLRAAREEALINNIDWRDCVLSNPTLLRELASLYRSDLTLVISEFEIDFLKGLGVPSRLICYVPFGLETANLIASRNLKTFEERKDLIFIGNFLHKPNVDAINFFVDNLWPGIRSVLSDVQCHIYGAYGSELNQPNSIKDIIWHGAIDSTEAVLNQSKVNLVPLRFGAGLKGKVLEAMFHGTPSVISEIGAEGVFGTIKSEPLKASNWDDFVDKVILLYRDEKQWKLAQEIGFEVVRTRFDKSVVFQDFIEHMSQVYDNLESHRKLNVIGAMLQRNEHQSTKYMAKWIEEKNR
jgi:O-antigen biosynthesis protein